MPGMSRIHFFLLLLLSPFPACCEDLRIMTYNVLYGFNHGKAKGIGANWIKEKKPDILALQELNGLKQDDLEKLAATWNHDHAVILKEKGFPVGLTARAPIKVIEKRLDQMWHGYLHCEVRGIHFFVVHLSPSQHAFRMKEANLLCAKIKSLLKAGESILVLGDFNCDSPLDKSWLSARPKPGPEADEKAEKRRAANEDPGYLVMSQFLELGLTDLVHARQPAAERESGTFPTRLLPHSRTNEQRRNKTRRIDFILADPALAKRCQSARIPRDEETDRISDHYPVEAILNK